MLILTRYNDQSVVIDKGRIVVTVSIIKSGTESKNVIFKIKAPSDMSIVLRELIKKIEDKAENSESCYHESELNRTPEGISEVVIQRKFIQSIVIDKNIIVKVFDIGAQAQVGFKAPRDILILREEVPFRDQGNTPPLKTENPARRRL